MARKRIRCTNNKGTAQRCTKTTYADFCRDTDIWMCEQCQENERRDEYLRNQEYRTEETLDEFGEQCREDVQSEIAKLKQDHQSGLLRRGVNHSIYLRPDGTTYQLRYKYTTYWDQIYEDVYTHATDIDTFDEDDEWWFDDFDTEDDECIFEIEA